MLRAIHIFPKFRNGNAVQKLREKYDPLFHYIPPHITLVFPFESELSAKEIGKFEDDALLKMAINETQEFSEKFETTVTEIVSEVISPNGESMVEARVSLGKKEV